MKKTISVIILVLGSLYMMIGAQGKTNATNGGGQGQQPPIFTALDTNNDGNISADEIANATEALKTLDKNGDGSLSRDEYIPPHPGESMSTRTEKHGKSENQSREQTDPQDTATKPEKIRDARPNEQRPPKPPIDLALDANSDGLISADEIDNAANTLQTLDKNGDGLLSATECLPARPQK